MLIDSHAHLDDETFSKDLESVLERAQVAGLESIINVGVDLGSSRSALALAAQYEIIYAACGIHPHEARLVTPSVLEQLSSLLAGDKVVGLGEIGLDYYRNLSPKEDQRRVFREQLALAREKNLPVVIHDREAHGEILEILQDDGLPEAGGVLHCFSGDWEMAQKCLPLGLYISFAGPVTFNKAANLTEVAAKAPLERILVETDCPYLAPEPRRGRRNEPSYVRHTAERIASLRGLAQDVFMEATVKNTRRLFYKMKSK